MTLNAVWIGGLSVRKTIDTLLLPVTVLTGGASKIKKPMAAPTGEEMIFVVT